MGYLIVNTGKEMVELDKKDWPFMPCLEVKPLRVWISNEFFAVLYEQLVDGNKRLTVNKTKKNGKDFRDGITWDDLQRIKNECLGEDVWCIECYPAQDELVNVCNQRHLWVLDEPPKTRFPKQSAVSDYDFRKALDFIKEIKKEKK